MVTENRPSGWYKDPSGQPNTLRWWNGSSWTDDFRLQSDFLQSSSAGDQAQANAQDSGAPAPPSGPQPPYTVRDEAAASQPTVAAPASGAGSASSSSSSPSSSPPWPGADRPIPQPITPVQFEAVEPNRRKRFVIMAVVAAVIAVGTGVGGYFLGQGDDDKTTTTSAPSSTPPPTVALPTDVASPDGFAGTPLAGGKPIAGAQSVTGPKEIVVFSVPTGWTPQVDPKATSEENRFVLAPYECTGRAGGSCSRGTVVHNLRLLSGGWSDLKSLTLGMGGELVAVQTDAAEPAPKPLKQQALTLQGNDAYLVMWDLPNLVGKTAPSSYCGVLSVRVGTTTEVAVFQMCLDRTAEAPPVSLMDEIANSIQVKTS
ncbi:DUF2510 domain-containing protein [Yinghuangia sp. YIM S09857]|uniref:DUF2510 domain-containing protein n=1 Tax=Yinghuangia sp. YIM S09857 TaxID=3436929 RepID=UPI003F53458F